MHTGREGRHCGRWSGTDCGLGFSRSLPRRPRGHLQLAIRVDLWPGALDWYMPLAIDRSLYVDIVVNGKRGCAGLAPKAVLVIDLRVNRKPFLRIDDLRALEAAFSLLVRQRHRAHGLRVPRRLLID